MPRPRRSKPNHGNLYEVKITIGKTITGKLIRKSFYSSISKADAKAQAEQYLITAKAAELVGEVFVQKDVDFRTWAEKWLETYKKGKVKDNTYDGTYRNPTEKHLIPYFGSALLTDIRPIDVQAFFNEKGKTSSLEGLKKMRTCLRAIFDTAVENDLCRKNPVTKNLILKSEVAPIEKRTYTQEQYDVVHAFAETHPSGLPILVLLETGMSRSELLGLKWEDFDKKERLIHIQNGLVEQKDAETGKWTTVSDGLKNEYRERVIPIGKELAARIELAPRVVNVGGNAKLGIPPTPKITTFIFHAPHGGAYAPKNWVRRVYQPFMEDLVAAHPEIPALNPHELRHTRATLWKDQKVDLFSIAKLLGHSDLDMLAKRYAHNNIDSLKEALGLTD